MTGIKPSHEQAEFCANPNCWLHHYRGKWGSGGVLTLAADYFDPNSGKTPDVLPTRSHHRHFQANTSGVKRWVCDSCRDFGKDIDLAELLAKNPTGFAIGHGAMVRSILLRASILDHVRRQYPALQENGRYLVVDKRKERPDGSALLAKYPNGFVLTPDGLVSEIIQETCLLALVVERNPIPPSNGAYLVVA